MSAIRVIIAEDEKVIRGALSDLINTSEDLHLVGTARDADEAIELAQRERPDVALVDVKMPGGGGPRAAREIRATCPETRVIALSAHDDRATVLEMLRSGAVGYLVKGASAEEILDAIQRSAAGQSSISSRVAGEIIHELVGQLELRDHEEEMRERRVGLLQRVVQGKGLTVLFQPILDLRTDDLVGVEALARFGITPELSPDHWFAEAGRIGLEVDLDMAAMRTAMEGMDTLPPAAFLSVNLSPATILSDAFAAFRDQAPMDRIVIELSEHAPVRDYDEMNAALAAVRERKGRVAIDDAGAGYSSMKHILRLRPDMIKLDMSMTRGVDGDPARRALVGALATFAAELGATIVAEGIETAEEFSTLRQLGVGYGQGFLIGLPQNLR